jgi:hypothetical protein
MPLTTWSASCPVALSRCARLAVWHRPVGSSCTVAVSCEWSTGLVQHCRRLFIRLAGINGAACPQVLQVMMA